MISLPWPDKRLSPNAREDRRAIAGVRKVQKETAFWLARKAGLRFPPGEPHVRVTFHPPDNRRRDLDNLLASVKSALDGIALATGVDDHLWQITIKRGNPVKDGAVVVECLASIPAVPFRGDVT